MLRIKRSSLASGLLAVAVGLFALDASADTVHWNNPSHQFDSFGAKPGTAVGFSLQNNAAWTVEVHQGQNGYGPLWYRSGYVGALGNSAQVPGINGYNPTIAVLTDIAFSGQPGHVVVAYQNQSGPGEMSYVIGTWDYNSPNTVSWSSETNFVSNTEQGYAPSITASITQQYVVCAYRNGTGSGPIQYKTAHFSTSTIGTWTSQAATDNGLNPVITTLRGTKQDLVGRDPSGC